MSQSKRPINLFLTSLSMMKTKLFLKALLLRNCNNKGIFSIHNNIKMNKILVFKEKEKFSLMKYINTNNITKEVLEYTKK
jgi:hypothetical protein